MYMMIISQTEKRRKNRMSKYFTTNMFLERIRTKIFQSFSYPRIDLECIIVCRYGVTTSILYDTSKYQDIDIRYQKGMNPF